MRDREGPCPSWDFELFRSRCRPCWHSRLLESHLRQSSGSGKFSLHLTTIALTGPVSSPLPLSSIGPLQLQEFPMSKSAANDHKGDENVGGPTQTATNTQVTKEEWERLRAPFSRGAYIVNSRAVGNTESALPVEGEGQKEAAQIGRSRGVIADLRVAALAIRDRLDLVLGPERYSYRLEPVPDESAERSVFCHLRIGTASRTGIGTDSSYRNARKNALADAAVAFGIGASGKAAGPILVGRESSYDVPSSILETLETRVAPSLWAPEESS